ncbi:MAG: hypothetical protein N2067_07275 [Spirochaetaceae bacterium]|nr:hypothetical protein [Spirochaetaceae bacterium]
MKKRAVSVRTEEHGEHHKKPYRRPELEMLGSLFERTWDITVIVP